MRKERKSFSKEIKRKVVEEFVSGAKTAQQIVDEYGLYNVQAIYKWKTILEEKSKGVRVDELENTGCPPAMAKRMSQLEEEIQEYQKKVAEQSLIIDLLKKLRRQGICPSESELSGLIATMKKLERK